MLATTAGRVRQNTADEINERIRRRTEANVARYASSDADEIEIRLGELDEEWDIERCLETMASSFTLCGLTLGVTVNRRWRPLAAETADRECS